MEEIGEKIVKSINRYFKNPQNLLIIEKLSKEGIKFKIDDNKTKSNILNGKDFCDIWNFRKFITKKSNNWLLKMEESCHPL